MDYEEESEYDEADLEAFGDIIELEEETARLSEEMASVASMLEESGLLPDFGDLQSIMSEKASATSSRSAGTTTLDFASAKSWDDIVFQHAGRRHGKCPCLKRYAIPLEERTPALLGLCLPFVSIQPGIMNTIKFSRNYFMTKTDSHGDTMRAILKGKSLLF